MIISLSSAALNALAAQIGSGDPSPIIYVIGRTSLYDDPTSPDKKELADASSSEITDAVKEALPYAAKAVLLGQWDEYSDKTYDLIMQFFDGYALDENGNVKNSSGPAYTWSEDRLSRDYKSENTYTYRFEYDARLSPLEIADDLNDYIEAVKRVTGKDTVSLIGRCLGANIEMAYIHKYQEPIGYTGLDTVVFYTSSFHGVDMLESAMSGTVKIESDTASEFLNEFDLDVDNDVLNEVIGKTLKMLNETYGIELTAAFAQSFYEHIKDNLIKRFLLGSIGSTPGYWSMVYDKFDLAKEYLFPTDEDREKYAGMLAKVDEYRNDVQLRGDEIIRAMQSAGVEVAAICKYGFRGYPLYENSDALTDGDTTVPKQSFGATCSAYNSTLDGSYIESRTDKGFGGSIAPDKQIDASTGLLPETTWYIKNLEHSSFPEGLHSFLNTICRTENFTVNSDDATPQFLFHYEYGKITPLTEENCDPNNQINNGDKPSKNPVSAVKKLIDYVIDFLKMLRNLIMGEIKRITGRA